MSGAAASLPPAMLPRVLEPETLDHLAADDPRAQRSRRDLRRVNAFMGARRILERNLQPALERPRPPGRPLRIVELGCGDGLLLLDVARRRPPWAGDIELTLLDRQPIVAASTLAAYAALGWRAEPLQADVMAWAGEASGPAGGGGEGGRHWDVAIANLFLHHFDAATLQRLLAGCARRCDAVVACEPRRSRFALAAGHLVVFLGANDVTRRDTVLSVRAGFVGSEVSAAWAATAPAGGWQIGEYDDGLFTHCFRAVRGAADGR